MAILHGGHYLPGRLWHACHLLLAVHDPDRHHHRRSRGASLQSCFHVLGRGSFRLSTYANLHCGQLHCLQRQGRKHARALLEAAHADSSDQVLIFVEACAGVGAPDFANRLASSTAKMATRKIPSNVPAPPMDATGAPIPCTLSRLSRSAPMRVPRLPPM